MKNPKTAIGELFKISLVITLFYSHESQAGQVRDSTKARIGDQVTATSDSGGNDPNVGKGGLSELEGKSLEFNNSGPGNGACPTYASKIQAKVEKGLPYLRTMYGLSGYSVFDSGWVQTMSLRHMQNGGSNGLGNNSYSFIGIDNDGWFVKEEGGYVVAGKCGTMSASSKKVYFPK